MNQQVAEQKWIVRRLERLRFEWADSRGLAAEIAINRGYLEPRVDSSPVLSMEVMQLTEHAWALWGPHVPVPPVRYAALVIPVLQMASRLHPLLSDWVLTEVGNHVRRHGWATQNRHLFRLAGNLKSGLFQSYSEWAIRSIDQLCSQAPRPIVREGRERASLQLLRSLYVDVGLAGLDERMQAWSKDHWKGRKLCPHLSSHSEAGNVYIPEEIPADVLSSMSPAGTTVRHLWNKDLLKEEGEEMRHCVGAMSSAIRAAAFVFLSLTEISTGSRATMVLTLGADGRWNVEELRGYMNVDLVGSKLEKNVGEFLININRMTDEVPLLQWYKARNVHIGRELNCALCEFDSFKRLRSWLPGIGSRDPGVVLNLFWADSI
jgi:hypothetical protein